MELSTNRRYEHTFKAWAVRITLDFLKVTLEAKENTKNDNMSNI